MSEKTPIEELLTEVSAESEARRHDPLPEGALGVRQGDGAAPRVLSVRLTDLQYQRLVAAAAEKDLPVSTMARLAILEQLDSSTRPASGPIDLNAMTEALRKVIRPEFLKAS
ncbi:hypothetical protein APR04_004119 [Promicromonospora umidemergens]|uniref:Ribbon-helix-helix CopG family protein n=1 Tax=Promicromonospora umidemergens TaxID=629679 RepID=A0ABP8XUK0_9MICO|nr:hypothetical protein [Promicromonospora umidemergens]MCP2285191.1 hypothetical protein [Promicromonospora umidemergens]